MGLLQRHESGADFHEVGGTGVNSAVADFVAMIFAAPWLRSGGADGERAERAEQDGSDGPVHGGFRVRGSECRRSRFRIADFGLRVGVRPVNPQSQIRSRQMLSRSRRWWDDWAG